MQEETIRRLERDRKSQSEKIEALEEGLGQAEDDRRQQKEKVMRLQQSEAKSEQEKEAMRVQIENAESRITKIELKKRSLEGTAYSLENIDSTSGWPHSWGSSEMYCFYCLCSYITKSCTSLWPGIDR